MIKPEIYLPILFLTLIVILVICAILSQTYIPSKNLKFRIVEKTNGTYTTYQAQIYRNFFGWTGFYASKYNSKVSINYDNWDAEKSEAEKLIQICKNLTEKEFTTKVV